MKLGEKLQFTLVELLVVISIIAILTSMLLPALSRARAVAKSSICQGNLKQLSTALTMYTSDFNGYMPKFYTTGDNTSWRRKLIDIGYINKVAPEKMPGNSPFICPLGAHDSHGWGEGDALPLYYYASSYGINVCVTGYYTWSPTTWRYLRISQIKKPSTNMELVESKHYWTVYYGIHYDLMRERHMNRMNTVFVDGHTAKIRKLEIGTGESGIPDDLFYKYWGIIRAY